MRVGRATTAVLVSAIAGPIGIWAGLIAALALVQQVVSGFVMIGDASWTEVFNPAVWFGWQNIAGNGSVLDSLLGGPGAPGGTASRYVVFMVFAMTAAACYGAVRAVWRWAQPGQEPSTRAR
jgi:hypothetical protein